MVPAAPGRSFGSRSREWAGSLARWLWRGRWDLSFTRRRYDDTTRYLTLSFTLIRHIHLGKCIAIPQSPIFLLSSLHNQTQYKATSKHPPSDISDNVHMIASTMRVEEDILPLRPP
jgi:hypothetical protein